VDDGPVDDGPVDDGPVDDGPVDDGPVDDPSTADDACETGEAGPCIDALLEGGLAALGAVSACLPATALPTPFGDARACSTGVCSDGSSGCPIDGVGLEAVIGLLPDGSLELLGTATLARPLRVPVLLPSLLGGGTCNFDVTAVLPDLVASIERVTGDGAASRLRLVDVSIGEPHLTAVTVAPSSALCGLLGDLLPALAAEQLSTLASSLIGDALSEIVSDLECTQCGAGGCPLRCQPTGSAPSPAGR
jgi:hypothetical protein